MAARKLAIPEVLTIPEVAAAIRISDDTVYRLIAKGDLDTCDVAPSGSGKPTTRIPRSSLEAFLAGRTRTAPKVRTHQT